MAFNLGTIFAEIGLNTKKLDDGLMKAQTKLAAADKKINTMGQSLTRNSTKFMVAGGVMAGAVAAVGVASIKTAAEFETSMRNVNSIAQLSEKEFADMSKQVVDLSKKLPQSAKTLADGLYDISSSGFAGAEGMKVLEAAAKAASAGMTDTATSAKGITAVLNAYGKEAEDAAAVSDTMFATVDKGVITFEELSGGIGNVLSTASLASIEFNELSGMIAYMTTKGVSADETMTALNRLILDIIKPSEQLAEVLKNAGYESGEMAIKSEGLVGVLALMEQASGGSLTKLQELSPEMRALKASGALLGGGIEELTGYMEHFKDTTGATNTALKEQEKALSYQIDLLKNNVKAIGIELGTELIPKVTETVSGISDWISKNSELTAKLIKVTGAIGGVTGAALLLLGVAGKLRALFLTLGAAGGVASGVIAIIVNLSAAIYGLTDTIKRFNDGSATWEDDWYRLAYPMIPVLENLLGIENAADKSKEAIKNSASEMGIASTKYMEHGGAVNTVGAAYKDYAAEAEAAAEASDLFFDSIFKTYLLTADLRSGLDAVKESLTAYNEVIKEHGENSDEAVRAQDDFIRQLDVLATNQIPAVLEKTGLLSEDDIKLINEFMEMRAQAELMGVEIPAEFDLIEKAAYSKISVNAVDSFYKFRQEIDNASGRAEYFKSIIDGIQSKTITITANYTGFTNTANPHSSGATGGMITPHGVVQSFAAGGMVLPQTGNPVPIIAHEGEMILNSSQQGNLIDALWGVANGKQNVSNDSQPIAITNVFEVDGQVIYQKTSEYLYKNGQTTRIGAGIR